VSALLFIWHSCKGDTQAHMGLNSLLKTRLGHNKLTLVCVSVKMPHANQIILYTSFLTNVKKTVESEHMHAYLSPNIFSRYNDRDDANETDI